MTSHPSVTLTEEILHRICSEFSEMPGLQLTSRQAQRLWGLDEATCTQVLNMLVEVKFLRRTGPDKYGRTTEGPVPFPRLRMAKVPAAVPGPLARKEVV